MEVNYFLFSGGDSKKIKGLDNLFSSEKKDRNDAVFQLLFYSLLLRHKLVDDSPIVPCFTYNSWI